MISGKRLIFFTVSKVKLKHFYCYNGKSFIDLPLSCRSEVKVCMAIMCCISLKPSTLALKLVQKVVGFYKFEITVHELNF